MKRTLRLKSYLLVFFAAVILLGLNLLVIIRIITPISLPGYLSIFMFVVLTSPTIIIWLYVSYKVFVPSNALPDSMQLKSFKQWILFWPCMIGFAAFWALLSYIFETFIPALPREDSEFALPLLVVATITIIISTTRLRYPVARFVGKIFETEPYEESSEDE